MPEAPIEDLIEYHRNEIEELDKEIWRLIAKRIDTARLVIKLKLRKGLAVEDKDRENHLINQILEFGQANGLSREFVTKAYHLIFTEAKLNTHKK